MSGGVEGGKGRRGHVQSPHLSSRGSRIFGVGRLCEVTSREMNHHCKCLALHVYTEVSESCGGSFEHTSRASHMLNSLWRRIYACALTLAPASKSGIDVEETPELQGPPEPHTLYKQRRETLPQHRWWRGEWGDAVDRLTSASRMLATRMDHDRSRTLSRPRASTDSTN